MIRTCESCGKRNRIPARHLADSGRCGACKSEIPPLSRPLEVDAVGLDDIVSNATVPVLVDFWAEWCGPCRMAAPVIERVARDRAGEAVVLKVNTEAHPALASRYKISGIPTFLVFRNGAIARRQAGLVDQRVMSGWLAAHEPG